MQRFISNWLCVSTVFYKKNYGKEVDLFFFFFLRPLHLICPNKKIADLEFFLFFFRPPTLTSG